MDKLLTYSTSPHIKSARTTKSIMIKVCLALLPACIMGVVYFGLKALLILALSTFSAIASEYAFLLIQKKSFKEITSQFDFTSVITGLLVGMTIGTNYPWYAPIFGSVFAIVVVKMLFGGTGCNIVNPAIAGRIFIFISFQTVVTEWLIPMSSTPVAGATTLVNYFENGAFNKEWWELLTGYNLAGCIGETCKLALIVGAIYLAFAKIINIVYPLIYIAVTGLMSVALGGFDFAIFLPSILSGGLILGAFFMATDYTTTPNTILGNVIYFIALGLITAVLRFATKMETVSFAILLMNLVVPLIDRFILNRPFGYKKVKEAK